MSALLGKLRTRSERDVLAPATHYAQLHDLSTPPEDAYLAALPDARKDICHRLVRGVLRGSPNGLCKSVLLSPSDVPLEEPTQCAVVETERLLECIRPLSECCEKIALQPFPASESVLIAPVTTIHGYDRFRFDGPISIWTPETRTELDHPIDLVILLEREGAIVDQEQAARITAEIAESVANLALSHLGKRVLTTEIDAQCEERGKKSVLGRLSESIPASEPAAGFQRLLTDGHPFHPCAKIRRGMTATEGLVYAPEFTDRITLRFVAIEKEYALQTRANGADALTTQLCSMFPGFAGALEDAFGQATDSVMVPVHPWQFNHVIRERYDDHVVALPDVTHPATPLLNLRTVVPYGTEETSTSPLPHLKLALGVQTTNVVRTLSPQAVWNGPRVTDVLREIEARESFERLGFLGETAATCYHAPNGPHPTDEKYDDARNLSALVRTNPSRHSLVAADAYPVAASCLLAETAPGEPLIRDLIDEYATVTGTTSGVDAAIAFLTAYVDTIVPEQLLLMCKYGIALESHLQNCYIVFEDGLPFAVLVQDFGGIRVHHDRLADHELELDPYPQSDLSIDDEQKLYHKLYYALFQNHLGELIATIAFEFDVDESLCWRRVREQCKQAFDIVRADSAVPADRVNRDENALFASPATHKALTAMRLQGKRHDYVTSHVTNPFLSCL